MIDGYVLLFLWVMMCISVGISVYALWKVIDVEEELKSKKFNSSVSVQPKVQRRIRSPWD